MFFLCQSITHYYLDNAQLKKIVLEYITPILYVQKNGFDKKFFKRLDEQRHQSSISRKVAQFISKVVIAAAGAGVVIKLVESEDGLSLDVDLLKSITQMFGNNRRDLSKEI